MARPHPVVRVGAILTDSAGRSRYETYVGKDLLGKEVVAVAPVEGLQLVTNARLLHGLLANDRGDHLGERCNGECRHRILLVGRLLEQLIHLVGHVGDLIDRDHLQSRTGQLLTHRLRPDAVTQVVVLYG